jgi:hypothetical protein
LKGIDSPISSSESNMTLPSLSVSRLLRSALVVIAVTAGAWSHSVAYAVPLSVPASPAFFADTALPGTRALADTITPFSFQGITGTVQSRVVRETVASTLDFYWKVNVAGDASGLGVSAFRLTDFGLPNITDADWRIDGGGTKAPGTARLFSATSQPGGSINYLLTDPVLAGESSRLFFLHTNATAFSDAAKFDLLTGGPQNLSSVYTTYAPAVPEPSTYLLSVLGLGVVGLAMRRRHQA